MVDVEALQKCADEIENQRLWADGTSGGRSVSEATLSRWRGLVSEAAVEIRAVRATAPDVARAMRVDASDEVRLAAGWWQEHRAINENARYHHGTPPVGRCTPAPGPAGMWRLHASGVWVRWVVAS